MSDATRIQQAIERGEPLTTEQLLPLVYDDLRQLATRRLNDERAGQTLQATALVHEVFLRLMGNAEGQGWANRGHFFAAAAEAMRRILINRARDKKRLKRGGGRLRVQLDDIGLALDTPPNEILALDEALADLAAEDPLAADLVKLKFFAGLTLGESAECLGTSRRTADRLWAYARAWLFERLSKD